MRRRRYIEVWRSGRALQACRRGGVDAWTVELRRCAVRVGTSRYGSLELWRRAAGGASICLKRSGDALQALPQKKCGALELKRIVVCRGNFSLSFLKARDSRHHSPARPTPREPTKFSEGNPLFYTGADAFKIGGPRTKSSGVRVFAGDKGHNQPTFVTFVTFANGDQMK